MHKNTTTMSYNCGKFIFIIAFLASLTGCFSAFLDESNKLLFSGDIEGATVALEKELGQLDSEMVNLPKLSAWEGTKLVGTRWSKADCLANLYIDIGRYKDAIDVCDRYIPKYDSEIEYTESLPHQKRSMCRMSPFSLFTMYMSKLRAYVALNDFDQARMPAEKAYNSFVSKMSSEHECPYSIACMAYVASIPPLYDFFMNIGETSKTDKIVEIIERVLKPVYKKDSDGMIIAVEYYFDNLYGSALALSKILAYDNFFKENYRIAEVHFRFLIKEEQKTFSKVKTMIFFLSGSLLDDYHNLTELYLAKCLIKQDRIGEALEIIRLNSQRIKDIDMIDAPQLWEYDKLMGDIFFVKQDFNTAVIHYKTAVNKIERMRFRLNRVRYKILFDEAQNELYSKLIICLINDNSFREGFNYAERARSRTFLDMMGGIDIPPQNPEAAKLYARRNSILQNMENIYMSATINKKEGAIFREIIIKEKELQATERDITKQYPELGSIINVNVLSLDQLQNSLEPNIKILEYYITEDITYAWLIGNDFFQVFQLPVKEKKIIDLINQCRMEISDPTTFEQPNSSKSLYQLIFSPIEKSIDKNDILCVVPHRQLHHLPFQVLHDGQKYLVEKYPIFYAPSANLFSISIKKRISNDMSILALGNPNSSNQSLALPYAEMEVLKLKAAFPDAEVYFGTDASPKVYFEKSPQYKIIHLATHGTYLNFNPLLSGLLLSGQNKDPYLLTVEEIFKSRLNAYLVTLSACESGLGKVTMGDELIGLNRAFLYAGASSVAATLWKVDDQATSELIFSFYSHLGRMNKVNALRFAQLDTMREHPAPYYWGAFVLTGDWM